MNKTRLEESSQKTEANVILMDLSHYLAKVYTSKSNLKVNVCHITKHYTVHKTIAATKVVLVTGNTCGLEISIG